MVEVPPPPPFVEKPMGLFKAIFENSDDDVEAEEEANETEADLDAIKAALSTRVGPGARRGEGSADRGTCVVVGSHGKRRGGERAGFREAQALERRRKRKKEKKEKKRSKDSRRRRKKHRKRSRRDYDSSSSSSSSSYTSD